MCLRAIPPIRYMLSRVPLAPPRKRMKVKINPMRNFLIALFHYLPFRHLFDLLVGKQRRKA